MAVGIDGVFFGFFFMTVGNKQILSTRQINSNTHQYAATFKIASYLCYM